ncbi:tyrosine-type recombinase/integrase [Patescibacteria group bacterium]|nr:tyrosine-type recombinase/integrase [Patescibacteria group bacterium]
MPNSRNKTIIEYIPIFLDYCRKEKKFSPISVIDYERSLKVFILFLNRTNNKRLFPHQLDKKIIKDFKFFISNTYNKNGSLKDSTKNYYLITLRSLVLFFIKKNIKSLAPDRIQLIKISNSYKKSVILSLREMKILRSAPDISKISGLRDRAIIELILSSGLKVSQVTKLNRNQFKKNDNFLKIQDQIKDKFRRYFLSDQVISWLKKYLETRKDNDKSLFINYLSRDNFPKRLTARSIQKTIKRYVIENNLPLITPETMRNMTILNLYNENYTINSVHGHSIKKVNLYKYSYNEKKYRQSSKGPVLKSFLPSWHIIEESINKEYSWLKEKIDIMPPKYKSERNLGFCDDCLFRKIAILIVSGRIKATEYKPRHNLKSPWNSGNKSFKSIRVNRHGKEWHKKTIRKVANYFKSQKFKVILEPNLNYGRADLGIITPFGLIVSEIGTISLLKLWYNLSVSRGVIYLVIPCKNYMIEFKT